MIIDSMTRRCLSIPMRPGRLAGAAVLSSVLAFGLTPVDALGGQGQGHGSGKPQAKADKNRGADADFDRDSHVRIIREFARDDTLPPGLAKRESLPPGLQKQLRERGALPPGLEKHLVPLPARLVTRLPAIPTHYQRYFAGNDLIVVDTQTNRILAIVRNIWG